MKSQAEKDQEAANRLAKEYADHSPGMFWSWGGVINVGLKCIAYGRANPSESSLYDFLQMLQEKSDEERKMFLDDVEALAPGLLGRLRKILDDELERRANPVVSGLPKYDYDDKILNDWSKNKRDSYPKPMHYGDLLTIIGGIARRAFERGQKSGVSHERAKMQEVRDALEYYADLDSWGHISPEKAEYSVIQDDLGDGNFDNGHGTDDMGVGGFRARKALAFLDGEEK